MSEIIRERCGSSLRAHWFVQFLHLPGKAGRRSKSWTHPLLLTNRKRIIHKENKQGFTLQKPTQRFSNRVDNYIKYRPGYPAEIVDFLGATCNLAPTSTIADVGSGTGLLSKLFLNYGNPVLGIEPNPEMRQAGEQFLHQYPNFTSIDGTAEETMLPNHHVDFVVAGQAFHWFEPTKTVAEFKRILKPGGWVVLIWNERLTGGSPFLVAYETLLEKYAAEYTHVNHTNLDMPRLEDIFGAGLQVETFSNKQTFDFDSLKGRLLSSSYAPLADHPNHRPMMNELRQIFQTYQQNGSVEFKYSTQVYYCQLQA